MIPIDVLTVFFLASVLLAMAPGPDNIFVLTQSALHGPRAGWIVVLGLCTGLLVHTSAVALGVAAIFQASALAFTALKAVGVAYLLYLAWEALRAGPEKITAEGNGGRSLRALYARGIVMNITNPKVGIFFLAFLPQFVSPERGSLGVQMVFLGGVFILATFIVFSAVAWGAGKIGDWLRRSPRAQVVMNRVAGTVFVGLAGSLAFSQH